METSDIVMAVCAVLTLYSLLSTNISIKQFKQSQEDKKIADANELTLLKERQAVLQKDLDKAIKRMDDFNERLVSSEYIKRISEQLQNVLSLQMEVEKLKMIISIKEHMYDNQK